MNTGDVLLFVVILAAPIVGVGVYLWILRMWDGLMDEFDRWRASRHPLLIAAHEQPMPLPVRHASVPAEPPDDPIDFEAEQLHARFAATLIAIRELPETWT